MVELEPGDEIVSMCMYRGDCMVIATKHGKFYTLTRGYDNEWRFVQL